MSVMRRWYAFLVVAGAEAILSCHGGGGGPNPTVSTGDLSGFPLEGHMAQAQISAGMFTEEQIFQHGDNLFGAQFAAPAGVGVLLLPDGTALPSHFSRVPPGGGRFTGPNGTDCTSCHNVPIANAAGDPSSNVVQDPSRLGIAGLAQTGGFNLRNPISLFGAGVKQRLAEEMTEDLQAIRDEAQAAALAGPPGTTVSRELVTKGVSFGRISATQTSLGVVTIDTSAIDGIDHSLVVRPYGWKGNMTTLRDFARGAFNDELGMQAVEVVAKDPRGAADPENTDLDGDGVVNEVSIGDITAMTIYLSAQPIPTTTDFLVENGFASPPTTEVSALQSRGRTLFSTIGCVQCHTPELPLKDVVFSEPSGRGRGAYVDSDLLQFGVDSAKPFSYSLVQQGDGFRLVPDPAGGATIALFSDLKRHEMGRDLADTQPMFVNGPDGRQVVIDGAPVFVPVSVFLTPALWSVGNTGPWLHDGRAASLAEAILLHGADPLAEPVPPPGDANRSEAQEARDAFSTLSPGDQTAVVEFLKSLQVFKFIAAGTSGS